MFNHLVALLMEMEMIVPFNILMTQIRYRKKGYNKLSITNIMFAAGSTLFQQ